MVACTFIVIKFFSNDLDHFNLSGEHLFLVRGPFYVEHGIVSNKMPFLLELPFKLQSVHTINHLIQSGWGLHERGPF